MDIPEEIIIPWKVRISPQARMLLSNLQDTFTVRELALWVVNDSNYGEIGGSHIMTFLQERQKKT